MKSTKTLTLSALLTAMGILLPMIMPIKLIIGPASFTLASHVPVFIAMFLSPTIAIATALGSTLGFFLAGFPIIIVFRALSHVLFAGIGAYWLQKKPVLLANHATKWRLSLVLNSIHAIAEYLVVLVFAFLPASNMTMPLTSIFLLVGVGTLIHGAIDFEIASWIYKTIKK
ncbi:ECF transporter S component [Aerococcaceae bacterium NML130460]|nr:ECF transporter S component [Aerococcaceae bacterium NML171108]MCW6680129.1 ECF transporter S component [Aerococcaceae bacterium NML130460]